MTTSVVQRIKLEPSRFALHLAVILIVLVWTPADGWHSGLFAA